MGWLWSGTCFNMLLLSVEVVHPLGGPRGITTLKGCPGFLFEIRPIPAFLFISEKDCHFTRYLKSKVYCFVDVEENFWLNLWKNLLNKELLYLREKHSPEVPSSRGQAGGTWELHPWLPLRWQERLSRHCCTQSLPLARGWRQASRSDMETEQLSDQASCSLSPHPLS